jgi:hypothetical protein
MRNRVWSGSTETVNRKMPLFGAVKMKAACSSKLSVPAYKMTWCHNPEDHNLNNHCHEASKVALVVLFMD